MGYYSTNSRLSTDDASDKLNMQLYECLIDITF